MSPRRKKKDRPTAAGGGGMRKRGAAGDACVGELCWAKSRQVEKPQNSGINAPVNKKEENCIAHYNNRRPGTLYNLCSRRKKEKKMARKRPNVQKDFRC